MAAQFDPLPWKPLPDGTWGPTVRSLHRWSQVVGKVPLALAAPVPHWWHVALSVTPTGLRTTTMPVGGDLVELELDLRAHALVLRRTRQEPRAIPLRPMSVASFHAAALDLLASAGLHVPMRPVPVEVVDAIPFAEDGAPGGYDEAHAVALHEALLNAQRVLAAFRATFLGKCSPVQFWWGSCDLAVSRFSGRRAPSHPGGPPNLADWVTQEAYSHEVSGAGWWPGDEAVGPSFYSYFYPAPPGFSESSTARLPGETYDAQLGEYLLPYATAVASDDPDRDVLDFLQRSYASGAALANWDRPALERPAGAAPRPGRRVAAAV